MNADYFYKREETGRTSEKRYQPDQLAQKHEPVANIGKIVPIQNSSPLD